MNGFAARSRPFALAFFSSLCIMVLELVASRLVGRHVGMSLGVWTSVIGIMLGGICLGNVLGGRLADRVEPRRSIGPLFALATALVAGTLWMNALVGLIPPPSGEAPTILWDLRAIVVVTLNFLLPTTVLGMISPVVAKIAVEQSTRSGSAIGDVYFWGAIGSIVGTFIAGFWLIYMAPTSVIVAVVAAALAFLTAAMAGSAAFRFVGLAAGTALAIGSLGPVVAAVPGISVGPIPINGVALIGHGFALALAVLGAAALLGLDADQASTVAADDATGSAAPKVKLADLSLLAFVASLAFMALEMVAGRIVQRHLGSSVYNWTSVIGVLLGGLSLGNLVGGKLADKIRDEKSASWFFLAASVLVLAVLFFERWDLVTDTVGNLVAGKPMTFEGRNPHSKISDAIEMSGYPWWFRVLTVTAMVFFLPSVAMGTVSPVVAKLAIDRVRRSRRTGRAIGQVYAWGMVGSILGTFLTGFVLIDVLGTKGVILGLSVVLAVAATILGSIPHAAWAGIPLGLTLMSVLPLPMFQNIWPTKLAREAKAQAGESGDGLALLDESNYYFIKVENEPYMPRGDSGDGRPWMKRTLVLDNLIHGYFMLGHPEHIEYDYEYIYAQVAHRVALAKAKAEEKPAGSTASLSTMFLGGGAYTFPRYLQHNYQGTTADVAEIDPSVTRANRIATGLLPEVPAFDELEKEASGQPFLSVDGTTIRLGPVKWPIEADYAKDAKEDFDAAKEEAQAEAKRMYDDLKKSSFPTIQTTFGDARQFVERHQGAKQYDLIFGDAFNDFSVPWHLTTREFNEKLATMLSPEGVYMINIIDVYKSDRKAIAQRLAEAEYRAVADALSKAGVPAEDCEQVARKAVNALDDRRLGFGTWNVARTTGKAVADEVKADGLTAKALVGTIRDVPDRMRGDAEAMTPVVIEALRQTKLKEGFSSYAEAVVAEELRFADDVNALASIASTAIHEARGFGGFLGAWVETARKTFPHVYVFGTDDPPGNGLRETFVIAVSRSPLDIEGLGRRDGDPQFYVRGGDTFESSPYGEEDLKALTIRSRGILLTDDYAPVENLLAPVAATRGDD